jgi:hypothetical protein
MNPEGSSVRARYSPRKTGVRGKRVRGNKRKKEFKSLEEEQQARCFFNEKKKTKEVFSRETLLIDTF